jgi:hypothetical protein
MNSRKYSLQRNEENFNQSKYLAINLFNHMKYYILNPIKTTRKMVIAKFVETFENFRYSLLKKAEATEEISSPDE